MFTEERRGSETILAVVWGLATVALALLFLLRVQHDVVHDPVQRAARGEIRVDSSESLVRPANFSRALAEIERRSGAGITFTNLRLDPVALSVQARDTFDNQRIVTVGPDFAVERQDFGKGAGDGFRLGRINAIAPANLLRHVRASFPGGEANYFVFIPGTGGAPDRWTLFLEGEDVRVADGQWIGDRDGNRVHRSSEPEPKA